jgi:uncharacterized FAD-dependent dehydrogenase
MMYLNKTVTGLRLSLDQPREELFCLAAKELGLNPKEIEDIEIVKESIDARRKGKIDFIYTVNVLIKGHASERKGYEFKKGSINLSSPPVVVGAGPAGLMASLFLSREGYRPIILERGKSVEERAKDVDAFWQRSTFDNSSNVQFGEGGAGTFSDGKLTTRINHPLSELMVEELIMAGSPKDIKYSHKPHIGTDILRTVVKDLRKKIIEQGGEFRFQAKLTDIIFEDNVAQKVIVNDNNELPCSALILAIGHSARDTYKMLYNNGIVFTQKPFSIGVRIEHLQAFLDKGQYGSLAGHPRLGAADYQYSYRNQTLGRATYTFCMCPGGLVVAASSEPDMVVTNGMSYRKRNGINGNSAVVVSIDPKDFGDDHPLAGVDFQRHWERKAFEMGGSNYFAPVQYLKDFLGTKATGRVIPTYKPGVKEFDISTCLPPYVIYMLREGLRFFDTKLKGFADGGSIITGVETRTSAPVRINRNEDCRAIGFENIYPIGEGAGYAGGIISSGVDGIKAAVEFMKRYKPLV